MKFSFLIIIPVILTSSCSNNSCVIRNDGVVDLYVCTSRYANQNIYRIQSFLDEDRNIKDGYQYEFYENGDTALISYYVENKRRGIYKTLYQGGQVNLFICYDSFGEDTIYMRQLDINGNIINESGHYYDGRGMSGVETEDRKNGNVELFQSYFEPPKVSVKIKPYLVYTGDTIFPRKSISMPNQGDYMRVDFFKLKQGAEFKVYTEKWIVDSAKNNQRIYFVDSYTVWDTANNK